MDTQQKMIMHSAFLNVLFLLSMVCPRVQPTSNASAFTKPGCQTTCGNLEIPYPFGIGIGSNCSISSPWFDIKCNTSFHPPKPYLADTPFEVVNISEAQIYVKNSRLQLAMACYGKELDNKTGSSTKISFEYLRSPYTFSDANQITSIGCDDLATVKGVSYPSVSNPRNFGGGCLSYCCSPVESDDTGSCPGAGCCRVPIPKGQRSLDVDLSDMGGNWQRTKLFHCSFAFIGMMDSPGFKFRLFDLNDSTTFLNNYTTLTDMPLVLDWTVPGFQNCSELAQNSADYACQQNSYCIDSDTGVQGYRCRCREGFDGNPYLAPGCHDIDECNNSPCDSNGICINTPGSYNCSCHDGYIGDGKRNGSGCFQVPGSKNNVAIGAGLGSGMGLILLLSTCFWLKRFLKKRKNKEQREKFFKRNGGLLLQQQISKDEDILGKIRLFTSKELDKASDRFNESRILGQGGQGTVYKGMLADGKIVAIKKSKLVNEKQVKQFINEVVVIYQINHRNIVKLLGCCLETEVPLLVYEFISHGTLFNHIHDESIEFPFSWSLRLKIAVEVAGALAYLHSAASLPIYHRDIKSSNILLDEKYIAKVSDFGISRSIEVDQTHLTTQVKGTFGYLDPEYFQSSQFTEKSDVYSFGVILVELLSGQKPVSSNRKEEERSLATRFLLCMEGNNLDIILDIRVVDRDRREELIAVAKLAQRCLNLNGKKRPTMKEVAMELESVRMSQTLPTTAKSKYQGVWLRKPKSILISEDDYTSTDNTTIPSSNDYPLTIHTS